MFEDIEPVDFMRRLSSGELWQLVDVREPWEREIAHVEPALHMPVNNIPMAEIPARYTELKPSEPVAVLCHSGARSARVAGFLAQQGFLRVANIRGGIDAWSRDSDPSIPRY
jgi:rhodanese-related sulfurtransferase